MYVSFLNVDSCSIIFECWKKVLFALNIKKCNGIIRCSELSSRCSSVMLRLNLKEPTFYKQHSIPRVLEFHRGKALCWGNIWTALKVEKMRWSHSNVKILCLSRHAMSELFSFFPWETKHHLARIHWNTTSEYSVFLA